MTTREVSYNLGGSVKNQSLPVAGTTIMLYDYWSTGSGLVRHFVAEFTTGPKGEYSFDVRKGIYSIEVVPNRDTRFARQSFDTIKVTNNTTLNINLKHGSMYSGKVRTESGEPIGSCELVFFCIEPESVRATEKVDSDGKFSISLPKGKYLVGCRQLMHGGTAFLYDNLHVVEIFGDTREDFVVPDLVQFKGLVTNSDGHPISGVRVTITSSVQSESSQQAETQLKAAVYSDRRGEFSCDVAPGIYDIKLEPGPESRLTERLVSSTLIDQSRTRTFSLATGYRLYGRVSFDGEGVENALVTVHGGKIDSSEVTDKDGLYSFSLSGGTYTLSVAAQPDSLANLPYRLLSPFSCTVRLAEDTCRDVELEKGVNIAGKVVDKMGSPRPGVQLAIYGDKGSGVETITDNGRPLAYSLTGDDGSFEFHVSPGKYWLIMNNQRSTAQLIEAAGEDLHSDLTWGSGCLARFEVTSEADEPIAHCKVTCEAYSGGSPELETVSGSTADDGICVMTVPAGIYSFRFDPPEQGSFQSKQIRQLSINADLKRRIKLPLKPVEVESQS